MMYNDSDHIRTFFKIYEDKFNNALNDSSPDVEGTVNSFANCFIGANPNGVMCAQNDGKFKEAIANGYSFYNNIGVKAMNILSTEITKLDNLHSITKVRWQCVFIRKDGTKGNVEFDNFYLTQTIKNETKIFAYITGDEQGALKEAGLI